MAYGFEVFAGTLTRLFMPDVSRLDLTRPWRDGGRDGIGRLRISRSPAAIEVDFALESKCYGARTTQLGRRVTADLPHRASRVRRADDIFLRGSEAYQEVADDGHPVILTAAQDIVGLLRSVGVRTPAQIDEWLDGITERS